MRTIFLNLIRSSPSRVLVTEPVCKLAAVDNISTHLHLHLRPDLRPWQYVAEM